MQYIIHHLRLLAGMHSADAQPPEIYVSVMSATQIELSHTWWQLKFLR
ncbi:MAG: hypothetical protein Q7S51_05235 [Gallionellaceae bacterium]|nr:hypothetical protein [Gallionellaceae bacterium]